MDRSESVIDTRLMLFAQVAINCWRMAVECRKLSLMGCVCLSNWMLCQKTTKALSFLIGNPGLAAAQ